MLEDATDADLMGDWTFQSAGRFRARDSRNSALMIGDDEKPHQGRICLKRARYKTRPLHMCILASAPPAHQSIYDSIRDKKKTGVISNHIP